MPDRLFHELAALSGADRSVSVSVAELAGRLGVAERTVQRAIGDLVTAGLLGVDRAAGAAPQRGVPNRYQLFCHGECRGGNAEASRSETVR